MPKQKRSLTLAAAAAAVLLAGGLAAGCGQEAQPGVVATTLPVYVLALGVLGDTKGEALSMLLPAGKGCPHDYEISPGDMEKLARARLVLANGAGLEEFLLAGPVEALKLRVADLSEGLKLIPLAPEEKGAAEPGKGGHVHAGEANPHTFASPRNAAKMTEKIGQALAGLDPANAERYRRNAAAQAEALNALADEFAAAAKGFPNRKIVTTHDVFDYLARDAGLEVVAVIEREPGQSPGLGAFGDLVKKLRDGPSRPAAIFWEPQYSAKPAELLGKEAGVPVYGLDPFATGKAEPGAYLAVMRQNLETLKRALGAKSDGG